MLGVSNVVIPEFTFNGTSNHECFSLSNKTLGEALINISPDCITTSLVLVSSF